MVTAHKDYIKMKTHGKLCVWKPSGCKQPVRDQGGDGMLKSCTRRYLDTSNERSFCFTFFCDFCEAAFQSTPILCTVTAAAKCSTELETELYKLRWQKEHAQAFARANQEASIYFFSCSGCGRYICPSCVVSTYTSAEDILDRCPECSARSNRKRPFRMIASDAGGSSRDGKEAADDSVWKRIFACADKAIHR